MKFETKFRILLLKRYFDVGYGQTSQFKYLLIAIGASWRNVRWITAIGIIYTIFCFFFGWWWFKHHWIEAEAEVGNRFNPLAKELRANMQEKKSLNS